MKARLRKSLALTTVLSLLAFGATSAHAQFGNVMLENWDAAPLGDIHPDTGSGYTGNWSSVGFHSTWPDGHSSIAPAGSIAEIRTDDSNIFGRGTGNHVLYMENAAGLVFTLNMPSGIEVATLSYETQVIDFMPDATNRLTNRFFTAEGTAINHGLQRLNDQEFRFRNEADSFALGELFHFDVIVNNSADTINYNSPDGTSSLDPGMTAVWADGVLSTVYDFGRDTDPALPPGEFTSFVMETFSNNPWTAYYDNVAVTEGTFVIPEPSTYALIFGIGALGAVLWIRRRRS